MSEFNPSIREEAPDATSRCLDGIEKFAGLTDDLYEKRPVAIDFSDLTNDEPSIRMAKVLWLLYAVYTGKFRELSSALITATNERNFLVFALCGRSLIETTSTLRYYDKKFLGLIQSAANPNGFSHQELNAILDLLDKHSRGGRFDWAMFWSSPRIEMVDHLVAVKKKKATPSQTNPEQINVNTTIDHWAADQPAARLAYDFFCEIVHPNLGSNFMTMGSKNNTLELCGNTDKSLALSIAFEGVQFLAPVIKEALASYNNLLMWAASITQEPPK